MKTMMVMMNDLIGNIGNQEKYYAEKDKAFIIICHIRNGLLF